MRDRLARLPRAALPGGWTLIDAGSPLARLRGLAGIGSAPAGTALLLPRTRSVHTVGMRFALDLVWLDRAGAPVRVDHDVAPGRLRTCRRARAVVEAQAGHGDALAAALVRAAASDAAEGP